MRATLFANWNNFRPLANSGRPHHKGSKMKYIMFEDFSGDPLPILIPNRIGYLEFREQIPYTNVLSAGYVQLRPTGITCHGEAKELNTAAREEDAKIISEKLEAPEY